MKKGFTTFSSHERGFTLIELLVVIAILGILSAGILTAINVTSNLDKELPKHKLARQPSN